jgi:NhaA family Na+:H+ antiporter
MAVPSLIYATFNLGDAVRLHGWAIPAATDIAFAVAVLVLVGRRIPPSLKIFLLALAIIDDLGAIVIIALFYTAHLSVTSLLLAGAGVIALLVLNLRGTARLAPYALVGCFIWVCVLKSGVHATLAGVVVALAIPLKITATPYAPLEQAEDNLHPWVAFGVLPLFGFANAGVSLTGLSFAKLLEPIPLGIALGLFLGKQLGIFGFTWLAIRLGLCRKPEGATWPQIYGVAVLGGVGFTMSLFIGTLAFPEPAYAADVRIGVLAGSLLSATIGFVILKYLAAVDAARSPRRAEKSG